MLKSGDAGEFVIREKNDSDIANSLALSVRGHRGTLKTATITCLNYDTDLTYKLVGTEMVFKSLTDLVRFYSAKTRVSIGIQLLIATTHVASC